ncbi:MAG: ABC transporter ATP-binding protein [Thermomicrobiales bacterium]|nr:ABC transporter ATP-binding protein [Thermomicrobiales bacterium]
MQQPETGSNNIRLNHVAKHFGSEVAVKDLELEIEDKELLVLLGPSGCGKTTTMNMLAGLEEPTSGEIWFGSRQVTNVPAEQRDVAMVFQTFALYPHLNVRGNIGFGLKTRGTSKDVIAQRVSEISHLLHIEELLDRKITELSGGQRQRVSIAKALVRKPFLFLLDEPFSSIDAILRRELRTEIVRIHREVKTTMVFVTHDQEEAMSIADRVAVMRGGELMQVGPPLSLYDEPANLWVAKFIGAQPTNVVPASLGERGGMAGLFDGSCAMQVDERFFDRVAAATDSRTVTLGVRPEFVDVSATSRGASSLAARVYTLQVLGNQILYDLEIGTNHLLAITSSREHFRVDQPVFVDFDWPNVMAFDAVSEARLKI